MNVRAKLTPEQTSDRILEVAEELFRRIGYNKTAIVDIASEIGMSSANIYRYFPSKSAINEAICRRMLDDCHVIMDRVAAQTGPASERLVAMILAMHDYNSRCYTSERRMHDMVEAAMEENWGVVQAHMNYIVDSFAALIEEGIVAGELRLQADPRLAGLMLKQATTCILHPLMIAERERHGLNVPGSAEALARFAVQALRL